MTSKLLALSGSALLLLGAVGCSSSDAGATGDDALTEDSPSAVAELPIKGTRACPPVVKVGIRGDSYIGGIKKTFDIKSFVAPGATLTLTRSQEGENIHLVYRAPLGDDFAACVGETEEETMFNPSSKHVVRFADGHVVVDAIISPSLVLEMTSTYGNQAIFEVGEQG